MERSSEMKYELLVIPIVAIVALLSYDLLITATTPRPAYPVACADIPESNEKLIIVRDGQVECHYKITKVRERK